MSRGDFFKLGFLFIIAIICSSMSVVSKQAQIEFPSCSTQVHSLLYQLLLAVVAVVVAVEGERVKEGNV